MTKYQLLELMYKQPNMKIHLSEIESTFRINKKDFSEMVSSMKLSDDISLVLNGNDFKLWYEIDGYTADDFDADVFYKLTPSGVDHYLTLKSEKERVLEQSDIDRKALKYSKYATIISLLALITSIAAIAFGYLK